MTSSSATLAEELRVRRQLMESTFVLRREDFVTSKEFKDYEELAETIILALSQCIDKPTASEAKQMLSEFRREHSAMITSRSTTGNAPDRAAVDVHNLQLPQICERGPGAPVGKLPPDIFSVSTRQRRMREYFT